MARREIFPDREFKAIVPPIEGVENKLKDELSYKFSAFFFGRTAGKDDRCFLCGEGIQNGMPGHGVKRSFHAFGSDASRPMVVEARINAEAAKGRFGIGEIDIRQCVLADLPTEADWLGKFDLVIAPNVISQLPEELCIDEYEDYIIRSLRGVRSVMKPAGTLMIDSRDWDKTFARRFRKTMRKNAHEGVCYFSEYSWNFGPSVDGEHNASMIFFRENERAAGRRENIRFVGRTIRQLSDLFERAGLMSVNIHHQLRGLHEEPFVTFELVPE